MNVVICWVSTNINTIHNVKKIITTLAIALTISSVATAQSCPEGCSASKPSPDAKFISSYQDGGYRVCNWLVQETNATENNEFSVKYQINLAKLLSTYDNNAKELVGLRSFIDKVTHDDNKSVTHIDITGYASPDGPIALNRRLSSERADDCCNYIKKNFDMSDYDMSTEGIALTWADAKSAISASSIPDKADVLELINSDHTASAIETKLRAMTPSWDYMKSNILPPMRRVEIEVHYNSWVEVMTRTPIDEIVEELIVANNYFIIIDNNTSEVVAFENSAVPIDFYDAKCRPIKERESYKMKGKRERVKKAKLKDKSRTKRGRIKNLFKFRK